MIGHTAAELRAIADVLDALNAPGDMDCFGFIGEVKFCWDGEHQGTLLWSNGAWDYGIPQDLTGEVLP